MDAPWIVAIICLVVAYGAIVDLLSEINRNLRSIRDVLYELRTSAESRNVMLAGIETQSFAIRETAEKTRY